MSDGRRACRVKRWRATPRLVVLCDQVRDPGNLGTVIRCADAFGADAVLVSRDSVDVYNAKTVRATTGSLFHLPLAIGVDLADAVSLARNAGLQVFGADSRAPSHVDDLARSGELAQPTLWVLGNEAWGLQPEHAALLDRLVALPIYGRAESLNLSTAAAVFLYASATAQRSRNARNFDAIARAIALTIPVFLTRSPTKARRLAHSSRQGRAIYRRSQSKPPWQRSTIIPRLSQAHRASQSTREGSHVRAEHQL